MNVTSAVTLALELAPLGIRACLVLPGRAPATRFGEHARAFMQGADAVARAARNPHPSRIRLQ